MSVPMVSSDWLADRILGHRAKDVRDSVSELIANGDLEPGTRLPTIRALAERLDAKVSTVTDAWTMLRAEGLVETRRRGGTVVADPPDRAPTRPSSSFGGWAAVELVEAWPDTSLLPDVASFFAPAVDPTRPLGNFVSVTPVLRTALHSFWPFEAEALTTLPGGRIAMSVAIEAALAIAPGATAVETPGMLRMTRVLEGLSASTVGLESDDLGPTPASLRAALDAGATVIVYQPTARIPTGSSLTPERRDELAAMIAQHPLAVIVEEDPTGPLYRGASLGEALPDRTIRVTQFSRAFGPDIDMVAVGGSARLVERILAVQRRDGLRVSPLLQEVTARLLSDADARLAVDAAGERYRQRHDAFAAALARHGVRDASAGGLFAWIPAADPAGALATLAASGIRVTAGGGEGYGHHLRIATTRLPDDPALIDELAEAVRSAVTGSGHLDSE